MLRMLKEKFLRLEEAGPDYSAEKAGLQAAIRAELLRQHGSQYRVYLKGFFAKLEELLAAKAQLEAIQAEANKDAAPFFDGEGLDLRPGGRSEIEAALGRDTLAELKASAAASGFEVGN